MGATDHRVSSLSMFRNTSLILQKSVKLSNGSFASITHVGTVEL